jgi:4'-phosphopantetheinyl transferase EntD
MSRGKDSFDCAPLRAALAADGALIEARRIRPGDEKSFVEGWDDRAANLARRQASGAARIAARRLIGELGADPTAALDRRPCGAPFWPAGIIGSLAHDEAFAVAAVAQRRQLVGIGVDIEPAEPLPADIIDFVLNEAERQETAHDGVARRLVFMCKEAVYKAVHPLDGTPLEYGDVHVRLAEESATLRDGRRLRLATSIGERMVAVALAKRGFVNNPDCQ